MLYMFLFAAEWENSLILWRDKQKIMLEASEESAVPYVLDFHKRANGFMALVHRNNLAETQQKQKICYDWQVEA